MNSELSNDERATEFAVYWQPGCSSCLRAKEFLTAHGIDFVSVNVREDDSAMDRLEKLGARSIPVVTLGNKFVFAQDIDDLAEFVGIELNRNMLSPDDLMTRLDLILAAAQRYLAQLPAEILERRLPGRDRTYLDLAFHIFIIPIAFLDAVRGKELTFEHFERTPSDDMATADRIIAFGETVRKDLNGWWRIAKNEGYANNVLTYYGQHTTHSVLERTTWHTAQHARQLMKLLTNAGISPNDPLGEKELSGLPLPDEIYDDEIKLNET
jgi:glutaredoxin